jgi:hypothetical protein
MRSVNLSIRSGLRRPSKRRLMEHGTALDWNFSDYGVENDRLRIGEDSYTTIDLLRNKTRSIDSSPSNIAGSGHSSLVATLLSTPQSILQSRHVPIIHNKPSESAVGPGEDEQAATMSSMDRVRRCYGSCLVSNLVGLSRLAVVVTDPIICHAHKSILFERRYDSAADSPVVVIIRGRIQDERGRGRGHPDQL